MRENTHIRRFKHVTHENPNDSAVGTCVRGWVSRGEGRPVVAGELRRLDHRVKAGDEAAEVVRLHLEGQPTLCVGW